MYFFIESAQQGKMAAEWLREHFQAMWGEIALNWEDSKAQRPRVSPPFHKNQCENLHKSLRMASGSSKYLLPVSPTDIIHVPPLLLHSQTQIQSRSSLSRDQAVPCTKQKPPNLCCWWKWSPTFFRCPGLTKGLASWQLDWVWRSYVWPTSKPLATFTHKCPAIMTCFSYSPLLLGNDDLKSWDNPTFQGISEGWVRRRLRPQVILYIYF